MFNVLYPTMSLRGANATWQSRSYALRTTRLPRCRSQ